MEFIVNHETVAYGNLTTCILFQNRRKFFNLFRQPDIILVTEKNNIPCCHFRQMHKVLNYAKTRSIPEIFQFPCIMRTNRFHRLKSLIIGGIIAYQDFIGNARLPEQTFQLFSDIFFTVIGGEDNGNTRLHDNLSFSILSQIKSCAKVRNPLQYRK